jgi:integrase/recombinase XerD
MKHCPKGSLIISKAIVGFQNHKMAEGLSNSTLDSYLVIFKKWIGFQGDVEIQCLKSQDITRYLNWIRNEYVPKRITGNQKPLFPKTIRNIE